MQKNCHSCYVQRVCLRIDLSVHVSESLVHISSGKKSFPLGRTRILIVKKIQSRRHIEGILVDCSSQCRKVDVVVLLFGGGFGVLAIFRFSFGGSFAYLCFCSSVFIMFSA